MLANYIGIQVHGCNYIDIQCAVTQISKIPSDPYKAVLWNLGAFNFILFHPETQNNKAITTITKHLTCTSNKMDLPTPSDLPTAAITTIIRRFEHLSKVAMQDVFGKMPYPWQLYIISHFSLIKENKEQVLDKLEEILQNYTSDYTLQEEQAHL
jgi:hypothetical protein